MNGDLLLTLFLFNENEQKIQNENLKKKNLYLNLAEMLSFHFRIRFLGFLKSRIGQNIRSILGVHPYLIDQFRRVVRIFLMGEGWWLIFNPNMNLLISICVLVQYPVVYSFCTQSS